MTPFTFDIYTGHDGVPVVHVETNPDLDTPEGPAVRVYLNDEVIYEDARPLPPQELP